MVLPFSASVTFAPQTWVVRPRCCGVAMQRKSPIVAVPRKLVLSSMVVKPLAPSGRCAKAPMPHDAIGQRYH